MIFRQICYDILQEGNKIEQDFVNIVKNIILMSYNILKKTLSNTIIWIIFVISPFQFKKVFFTENSFIGGYHSFYNSIFIYISDILVIFLILAWLWEKSFFSREIAQVFHRIYTYISQDIIYKLLILFWIICSLSAIFSRENHLSIYGLLKLTEYLLFFAYIRENVRISGEKFYELRLIKPIIIWAFVGVSVFEAILGIYQYLWQKSFGFHFIGEEYLRPGISGIAEFFSREIVSPIFYYFFPYLSVISNNISINIRAYGTFPHPNLFGAYLVFSLVFCMYFLYISREKSGYLKNISREIYIIIAIILITTAIVCTFSRIIWLVTLFILISWGFYNLLQRNKFVKQIKNGLSKPNDLFYKPKVVAIILFSLVISVFLNIVLFQKPITDRIFGISNSDFHVKNMTVSDYQDHESIKQRQKLNEIAVKFIINKPFFGVGFRNFVSEMLNSQDFHVKNYEYQPAHNIFLLVTSEIGVFGGVLFVLVLVFVFLKGIKNFQSDNIYLYPLMLFAGFLLIGFFDHYFLTLQQGSLLFWGVLGLVSNKI